MKINNKGVTLVALVITIIVLVILGGTTLGLVIGENGLINKAKYASLLAKKNKYYDEINLEIADEHMERINQPKSELFIVSLQKRLEGTPTASNENVTAYAKKEWVKNTEINLDTILVVYTEEDYQILIEVDNDNNMAQIVEESFAEIGDEHTISFDGNSGIGTMESQSIREGLRIRLPICTFEKSNYTFVGWYKNAETTGERYDAGEAYTVTEDEVLYAKWSQHAITIKYNPGFETETTMSDSVIEIDELDNLKEMSFSRPGYSFTGWIDQNNKTYNNQEEIKASTDLNLTAQWEIINYSINYDLAGGTATNPSSYNIETNTFSLTNPTKDGFTFLGWSGSGLSGNTNQSVSITKGSTGERNYTANWTHSIKYYANGGSGTMTDSTGMSMKVKSCSFNVPEDCVFKEWNTNENGTGTKYNPDQIVTSDLKLYAQWTFIPITASTMKNNVSRYYGRTVNYTMNGVSDWKVLYSDSNNIFLISSAFLPVKKVPSSIDSTAQTSSNTCAFGWTGSRTAQTVTTLSSSFMFSKWSNYNTNSNAKTVSTLLNTNNWSGFVNTSYADYAIGSPTIEMWIASWNEIYPNSKLYCNSVGTYGYCIGTSNNPTTTQVADSTMKAKSGFSNTLYYAARTTNSIYDPSWLWLSSPSDAGESALATISVSGRVGYSNWNNLNGAIRPVVRLKGNVKLTNSNKGNCNYGLTTN